MYSENNSTDQPTRSFIERARRQQIIEATIIQLAEVGYINTSFARIATQAGVSPSLISYHFEDKDELTRETLSLLFAERYDHVKAEISTAKTAAEKLWKFLKADVDHMCAHPERLRAATEIVFNLRSNSGAMVFLGDSETPLFSLLHSILKEGKQAGEFTNIDTYNLAIIIDGARDTFLAQADMRPRFNPETYISTLYQTIMRTAQKDPQ